MYFPLNLTHPSKLGDYINQAVNLSFKTYLKKLVFMNLKGTLEEGLSDKGPKKSFLLANLGVHEGMKVPMMYWVLIISPIYSKYR